MKTTTRLLSAIVGSLMLAAPVVATAQAIDPDNVQDESNVPGGVETPEPTPDPGGVETPDPAPPPGQPETPEAPETPDAPEAPGLSG